MRISLLQAGVKTPSKDGAAAHVFVPSADEVYMPLRTAQPHACDGTRSAAPTSRRA